MLSPLAHTRLFRSPGVDSSEDDDEEDTDDKALSQLKQAVSKGSSSNSQASRVSNATRLARKLRSHPGASVLYVGHLPRELQEKDLAHFLKQFGRVVHIRIARSKKTGNPKGYAFVQMANEETAAIVAQTLTGYILMGTRRLVCHVVPPERVHRTLFFQAQPPSRPNPPNRSSAAKLKQVTSRLVARERKKKALLMAAGIHYDFPGYEAGAAQSSMVEEKAVVEETTPASKKKKKRKDSVESSSNKKRKDSIDSSSSKKRKESIESSSSKKRKDSIGSSSSSKRKTKTEQKKRP